MRNSGFTLVEIMIVVVIIGILSAMVVPRLTDRREQARRWKATLQIREFQQSLQDFYNDNGFFPSQEEGLEILVERSLDDESGIRWKEGGYLRRKDIPDDPWGNHYVYIIPGLEEEQYSIITFGKDGRQGGSRRNRDIVSWELDKEI